MNMQFKDDGKLGKASLYKLGMKASLYNLMKGKFALLTDVAY